jgi:hypothetical protein
MTSGNEKSRPARGGSSENITLADTTRPAEDTPGIRRNAITPEQVACDCWAIAALDALAVAR